MIIAIDPGSVQTAWVKLLPSKQIVDFGIQPNEEIIGVLTAAFTEFSMGGAPAKPTVVCEMVACYGMPVGADVFETAVWIGRYQQKATDLTLPFHRMFRREVKLHLCNSMKAKDGNVRQALLDKLGALGTKKNPGPTYGISKDLWAALGVGITFLETKS